MANDPWEVVGTSPLDADQGAAVSRGTSAEQTPSESGGAAQALKQTTGNEQAPSDPWEVVGDRPAAHRGIGEMAATAPESMADPLSAAFQRTSPVVRDLKGNLNYTPLGKYVESDAGPGFLTDTGQFQRVDPTSHIVLRDPATNEQTVFQRSTKTDENALTSFGRLLGFGMLAPATAPLPMAAKAVQGVGAAARPGSEAAPNAASLMQDFERMGVPPTIPAVSQGRTSQIIQNTLRDVPLAAEAVEQKVREGTAAAGAAAERVAGAYGTAEDAHAAGDVIQQGIQRFAKAPKSGLPPEQVIRLPTRATSFAEKSGALFDRFFQRFGPDDQVPLTNTLEALKGPMDRFPSSPMLGKLLTNQKLADYYEALKPAEPMTPGVPEAAGEGAEEVAGTGGTLSIPELKELRSTIGRQLSEPSLVSDIPRRDLKNVYAGISRDMEAAAADKGPDALNSLNRANQYYNAGMRRIDQIEKMLGKSPEGAYGAVLNAARSGAQGDIDKLMAVQRSMPPEQWGDVASGALREMGKPTPSVSDPLSAADFSPSTFVTNFQRLSPAGKSALFDRAGAPDLRQNLDALVRVAAAQKNVARLANASGTGRVGTASALAYWFAHDPVGALSATVAGNLGARAMMSPTITKWLVTLPASITRTAAAGGDAAQGLSTRLAALDALGRTLPEAGAVARQIRQGLSVPSTAQSSPGSAPGASQPQSGQNQSQPQSGLGNPSDQRSQGGGVPAMHDRRDGDRDSPAGQRVRASGGRVDEVFGRTGSPGRRASPESDPAEAARRAETDRIGISASASGGYAAGGAVRPSTPEPAGDIAAQVRAMLSPGSAKDAVFIAAGTPLPAIRPKGVYRITRPEGTLLTTNHRKAAAFQKRRLTDGELGHILDLPSGKEEAAAGGAHVVQARDRGGNVVTEAAVPAAGVGRAVRQLGAHVPPGGAAVLTDPLAVQERRRALARTASIG